MPRRLLILGSTGSIGTQALDIVARSDELELVGLCAERSWEALVEQARAHGVARIALADADAGARARPRRGPTARCSSAPRGSCGSSSSPAPTSSSTRSSARPGLGPTVATLGEGIDLALANKESLVVGGELVMQLAEATGAQIMPVDSEHSALHQLLAGEPPGHGRPARADRVAAGRSAARTRDELEDVTVEEALAHPTWAMGGKITIDSATLMNKGLEVIEAHHLFGTPYERIDVVVHPQSIVHSYVLLCDGAALAHLGYPDMRVPIAYALHHPERVDVPVRALDLAEVGALTFEPVDVEAFPCLRLAREAAVAGGTAPCVLNAANEVAVHAFLDGPPGLPRHRGGRSRRRWTRLPAAPVRAFESLYEADREAREAAAGARRGARADVSWVLAFVGFAAADHPARARPLRRGQGRRDARRALRAVLPAAARSRSRRGETEYGDRRDPARRLREDHRDEPARGARRPRSSRAPTTASRSGSGSS